MTRPSGAEIGPGNHLVRGKGLGMRVLACFVSGAIARELYTLSGRIFEICIICFVYLYQFSFQRKKRTKKKMCFLNNFRNEE